MNLQFLLVHDYHLGVGPEVRNGANSVADLELADPTPNGLDDAREVRARNEG